MGNSKKISKRIIALLLGALLLLALMPFALRVLATADDEDNTPLLDKELVASQEDLKEPLDKSDPNAKGEKLIADITKSEDLEEEAEKVEKATELEGVVLEPSLKPQQAFEIMAAQETVTDQVELEAALADSAVLTIIIQGNISLNDAFVGTINTPKTISGATSDSSLVRSSFHTGSLFTITSSGSLSVSSLKIEGAIDSTANRGPLITVNSGATLNILDGANLSNNVNTTTAQPWGGAICNLGTTTLSGGTITGNKVTTSGSVYGGGIYNAAGATLDVVGGSISSNRIEGAQGYGGGIYVAPNSTFSMVGGTLSSNVVSGSTAQGGGLYLGSTPTSAIGLGAILSNTASGQGGGIFAAVNCIFSGTRIANNSAVLGLDPTESGKGGGIYVNEDVKVTVRGATVIDDNEAIGGGGIYVVAGGFVELMKFDGVAPTISNNVATGSALKGRSGDGGGIWSLGTITAAGGLFSNNAATDNGGGLSARSTGSLSNVSFVGNRAFYGGGLRVSPLASIVSDSLSFSSNNAEIGGGVMNHGRLTLRGTTVFQGNSSNQLNGEGSSLTNLWLKDAASPELFVEGALSIDTPILLATDPATGAHNAPVRLIGALTSNPLVIGGFGRVNISGQGSADPGGDAITADSRFQVTVDLQPGDVLVRGSNYQITSADWAHVVLSSNYSAYSTLLTDNNEIIVAGGPAPTPTPTPTPTPNPTPPGPSAGTGDYMLEAADVAVGFSLVGLIAAFASAVHIRRRLMKRR